MPQTQQTIREISLVQTPQYTQVIVDSDNRVLQSAIYGSMPASVETFQTTLPDCQLVFLDAENRVLDRRQAIDSVITSEGLPPFCSKDQRIPSVEDLRTSTYTSNQVS